MENAFTWFGVFCAFVIVFSLFLWVARAVYDSYQYSYYKGLKSRIGDTRSRISKAYGSDDVLTAKAVDKILVELMENTWPNVDEIKSSDAQTLKRKLAKNAKTEA